MCIIDLKTQAQRGISIAEMWIAIAVSGIILGALLGFTLYTGKSFAALTNYVDLEQKSQKALDTMTKEIRQSECLLNYGTATVNGQTVTNSVTFLRGDGQPVTYAFSERVLSRNIGGTSEMLLTNCDFLTFQIYQRNPVQNQYEQFPSGVSTNGKVVSVSWICSRSILGTRANTESVQTAKIVIRKE